MREVTTAWDVNLSIWHWNEFEGWRSAVSVYKDLRRFDRLEGELAADLERWLKRTLPTNLVKAAGTSTTFSHHLSKQAKPSVDKFNSALLTAIYSFPSGFHQSSLNLTTRCYQLTTAWTFQTVAFFSTTKPFMTCAVRTWKSAIPPTLISIALSARSCQAVRLQCASQVRWTSTCQSFKRILYRIREFIFLCVPMRRSCLLTRGHLPICQRNKSHSLAFILTLSWWNAIRGRANTSAAVCFIEATSSQRKSIVLFKTSSAKSLSGSLSGRQQLLKLASIIRYTREIRIAVRAKFFRFSHQLVCLEVIYAPSTEPSACCQTS